MSDPVRSALRAAADFIAEHHKFDGDDNILANIREVLTDTEHRCSFVMGVCSCGQISSDYLSY